MTLVGRSLHDLRKVSFLNNTNSFLTLFNFQARKDEHFSMGTAIGAAIQTLEAIQELHSIGYLHRDIKPGNYSIGRPERRGESQRIYILDFGMCRLVFLFLFVTNSYSIILGDIFDWMGPCVDRDQRLVFEALRDMRHCGAIGLVIFNLLIK